MTELTKRFITSIFLVIVIFFSYKNLIFLNIVLIVINYLLFLEFNSIFKNIFFKKKFLYFIFDTMALVYIIFISLWIWILLNSSILFDKLSLIFIILICVSSDIGGFSFGKIIGGKKFSKISPNKTYSGVVGSFIFALVLGFIFSNFVNELFFNKKSIIFLSLLISLASQIGDLFISFLKRKAKLKDTGIILPGHGGILDRLDGILLALPVGLIFMFN